MPTEKVYLLDANVFIEASRRYYAFDLVAPFWEKLIEKANEGRIRSIDRVKKNEIDILKDQLSSWASKEFSSAFVSTTDDPRVSTAYSEIMGWVQLNAQFFDSAKADFARGADGWLVAYAKVNNHVLVTHEEYKADIKRKVPIPNVCKYYKVEYVDTFEMMRALGVRIE